jgi:flagellum-specific peptidoglycan hydrolase FlgJ
MKPEAFVKKFYPEAKASEKATGVPALSTLVQAAIESAWGEVAPGNMFFGEKDFDGINGNEQLLTTTEYHTSMNVKYPVIISITPVVRKGRKMFKYRVKDYFRKFKTPEECFTRHGEFFLKNKRYAAALAVKHDPYKFMEEIAKAGYATDPNYADTLKKVAKMIEVYI